MPVYEYKCPMCGAATERTRSVEERDEPLWCGECDVAMQRKWGVGGVIVR